MVAGHLAEAPEREAGGQLGLLLLAAAAGGGELDAGDLELAEERGGLGAVADEDELDLGEDEAVAAAVLAHGVVDGGEAAEVLDALDVALGAHSGVEAVKGADEADDAGGGLAAEHGGGGGGLAGDVGGEEEVVDGAGALGGGGDGELEGALGAEGESRVELGEVVGGVDAVESGLGLWVAAGHGRLGEDRSRNGGVEQRGARESEDRSQVEGGPGADVANVPPEVLDVGVTVGEGDGSDQGGGRVGTGEEGHESGGGGWLRGNVDGGGHGQRGGRTGRVSSRWESEVGLLHDRHSTVGWVGVLVSGDGLDAAASAGVSLGRIMRVGKVGGRAEQLVAEAILTRRSWKAEVRHDHGVEGLRVGVATSMAEGLGPASNRGRWGGRHHASSDGREAIKILILRSDLGKQEGTMVPDRRASSWRSGQAGADRLGGRVDSRANRVDGGTRGRASVAGSVLPGSSILVKLLRDLVLEHGSIKGKVQVVHGGRRGAVLHHRRIGEAGGELVKRDVGFQTTGQGGQREYILFL